MAVVRLDLLCIEALNVTERTVLLRFVAYFVHVVAREGIVLLMHGAAERIHLLLRLGLRVLLHRCGVHALPNNFAHYTYVIYYN